MWSLLVPLARTLTLFLAVTRISPFDKGTALALPTTGYRIPLSELIKRADYPSDDDIREKCNVDKDKSVFFSQIPEPPGSSAAYNFATQNDKVIFRGAFPPKYGNRNRRPIVGYQDFVDRFSRIFAEKSSGTVYFVAPWNEHIDDCRVWTRIEYPALINNDAVDKIVKVNYEDFSQQEDLWTRPSGPFMHRRDVSTVLEGRATKCFDWDCDGEDQSDPDHTAPDAYTLGWCGVHVTQYQKPDPSKDHYRFSVQIFDAVGYPIAHVIEQDATNPLNMDSVLPYVFTVTAGQVDADAVSFKYAAQAWDSNNQEHHCDFGSYDSGKREGDCGFTCKAALV